MCVVVLLQASAFSAACLSDRSCTPTHSSVRRRAHPHGRRIDRYRDRAHEMRTPMDLQGKTAPITGASRGIGRACAQLFAALGARAAVYYGGNHSAAEQTLARLEGAGHIAVQANITDADAVYSVWPLKSRRRLEKSTYWSTTPLISRSIRYRLSTIRYGSRLGRGYCQPIWSARRMPPTASRTT